MNLLRTFPLNQNRWAFVRALGFTLVAGPPVATCVQGSSSAVNRAAARTRRNLVRRHGIISYTWASARQRAIAEAKAQELQPKLREKWQRKKRARARVAPAARVAMKTVLQDLNKSAHQAVRVDPSLGARDSVMAVNVETGSVVNSEVRITPRTDLSEKVREAAKDMSMVGAAPTEFVNGNISLTAI